MAIKLDRSSCTVVVWCTDCPDYAVIRWSLPEAYAAACGHESTRHPGTEKMRDAARTWARRAALGAMFAESA